MIDSSKIGPVEMLAVSFPGSQFKGEILPELSDLVDRGLVRVIDLVVVTKGEDGTVAALEVSELDPEIAAALGSMRGDLDDDGLIGRVVPQRLTAGHGGWIDEVAVRRR